MSRFRPVPRDSGIGDGLAARVHDPLWLLARQWQLGEFRAEDGGSPCDVDLEADLHRLDEWRPAEADDWRPYDVAAAPLERLVEEEGPAPAEDPRLRTEGGVRLARMLRAAGLEAAVPRFAARYAFAPVPTPPAAGAALPPDAAPAAAAPSPAGAALPARGLTAAVRRRVADGAVAAPGLRRLSAGSPAADAEAQDLGLTAADAAKARDVAAGWLAWWDARVPEVPPGADQTATRPATWDEHRLEHAFSVHATTRGDVELTAAEYPGGSLDWWAFDVAAPSEESDADEPEIRSFGGVPGPARFGGMPAARFWEMEDARFDPGAVDAAPTDLGRLLLVSFATVYGNDWLVVPLRMDAGALVRVRSLRVRDVFGGEREIGRAGAGERGWAMYALTDEREVDGSSPYFLLAPRLPGSLESPPVESVLFARDEMANLAWAIEQRIGDAAGEPRERFDDWVARPRAAGGADGVAPGPAAPPRYLVATEVPDHWFPLAPVQLADHESISLALEPLTRAAAAGPPLRLLPLGALLARAALDDPESPLWLHEEEVPRSGAAVVRAHQRARWHGGSVHAWTARRKGSGTGESSSGLRYDSVEQPR
ncbi:MAG TPA: hypothetical protein VG474_00995 [Solirubrobacteraceae bacterium]|nr:hypothetical protein [Solirubrobacteraceae bacterium]